MDEVVENFQNYLPEGRKFLTVRKGEGGKVEGVGVLSVADFRNDFETSCNQIFAAKADAYVSTSVDPFLSSQKDRIAPVTQKASAMRTELLAYANEARTTFAWNKAVYDIYTELWETYNIAVANMMSMGV